jgi:acid phosphatase family membrane protein YuiD
MHGLWSNTAIWVPLSAALFAQLLKPFWSWVRNGRFDLRSVASAGGMPSSHSAMVSSLATVLGFAEGLDSPLFAMAVILAVIVMYDARGVRQESGKQARVLNRIMSELFSGQPISEEQLKELLGHTASEVFFGAVVGIVYALLFMVLNTP